MEKVKNEKNLNLVLYLIWINYFKKMEEENKEWKIVISAYTLFDHNLHIKAYSRTSSHQFFNIHSNFLF